MRTLAKKPRRHCQYTGCGRPAKRREAWKIDDDVVVVRLCELHSFKGPAHRLISDERWATRTRLD